jgi:enterochelin esterase-like enzyme
MPTPQVTAVEQDAVVWRLMDPSGTATGVRLWSDYDLGNTAFAPIYGGWELRLPTERLPAVDRLEYLFEVSTHDETRSVLDPGNPLRVGGAFGDHSWLALSYQPPGWIDAVPPSGHRQRLTVPVTPVGEVNAEIWSPTDTRAGDVLPLLLAHDGPEMDSLGQLTRFVGAMIAAGRLPPTRVALLAPGARNERYAANPAYADALCEFVLPAVRAAAPTDRRPALMGQSLGGLAALHAEWTHPGTFGGLLLQSGSFFTPELDAQESGYSQWRPVTRFVAEVLEARRAPSTLPVGICFGTAEDNAANNRLIAAKLAALGWPVAVGDVRDGHNFTCWRDLLDPHLVELLRRT